MGESSGVETVALNLTHLPLHNHSFMGSSVNATTNEPVAGVALATALLPSGTANKFYGPMTTPQPLNSAALSPVGGNGPHPNLQPYLAINWCIALTGIFPSRG